MDKTNKIKSFRDLDAWAEGHKEEQYTNIFAQSEKVLKIDNGLIRKLRKLHHIN